MAKEATRAQSGFEALATKTVQCRVCFHRFPVESPLIDIAQPRWIGPRYWSAPLRVAIVMLNPGSGEFREDSADARSRALLSAFRDGTGSREAVLEHQARDMPYWGRGRFSSFYLSGLPLCPSKGAFRRGN